MIATCTQCRRLISTGRPGIDLIPAVIDPLNAPGVGSASPYLAIFAAFMGASCTDLAQLDEWFDSALTAETAADTFKS